MEIQKDLPCYVLFDSKNCTGCGACLKVCPTKAIRIKGGKSLLLVDNCIGGGECIKVCPQGCITPTTSPSGEFKKVPFPIIMVAPVLYSQFRDATPGEVLQGLRSMGFKYTVDMSYFFTLFKKATEQHLKNIHIQGKSHPIISTMCPVVLRLIAFRFPSLMTLLHPVLRPVSVMVKDVAAFIAKHHGMHIKDISIFYLNPCPTKMNPENSLLHGTPYISRAIGINQIYPELKQHIKKIQNAPLNKALEPVFEFEKPPGGKSLLWGISGGETAGTEIKNKLAISGMKETLEYLEKIELGLFREYDFIEFRTCREGCVGGSLCAVDKYVAKNNLQHHMKQPKAKKRHINNIFQDVYSQERFFDELTSSKMKKIFGQKKEPLSMDDLTKINRIRRQLLGFNCSACGSPDCLTFAEDVIRKRASLGECFYIRKNKQEHQRREELKAIDLIEKHDLVLAAGEGGVQRTISGGYCGDLLSDVMANARENSVWLTVQAHQNIVAVAVLKEMACIIIACGNKPDKATCEKADQENIPIFLSERSAFDLTSDLASDLKSDLAIPDTD